MKVAKDKVVSVTYTLKVKGNQVEKVEAGNPLKFILGSGMLLPKFEENLLDKEVGDGFEFRLSAADAYGEVNPQMIAEIPLTVFERNGHVDFEVVKEGNIIPMQDRAGHRMNGIIKEVKALEGKVTMDFNHPLAGEELHFVGKIEEVRDATEKELTEGLFGEKIPHECSGEGCSHCGGGCDDHDCSHDHDCGCEHCK